MREELPFELDALEPLMSAEVVEIHYNKHHGSYANKLQELIRGTEYEFLSLEKIIENFRNIDGPIFNNASQVFLHNLFWQSLRKDSFIGEVHNFLESHIPGYGEVMEKEANRHFGAGWLFLIYLDGQIKIETRINAFLPEGHILWVMDLWEHSYYLQFRYQRDQYIKQILANFMNYNFIYERLKLINIRIAPEPLLVS